MQVQTVFLSEFIYMQSSIPQTTKYQPFTYYPISVVYLGYLTIRLRYPKYTTLPENNPSCNLFIPYSQKRRSAYKKDKSPPAIFSGEQNTEGDSYCLHPIIILPYQYPGFCSITPPDSVITFGGMGNNTMWSLAAVHPRFLANSMYLPKRIRS